jgi:hypothetical protein
MQRVISLPSAVALFVCVLATGLPTFARPQEGGAAPVTTVVTVLGPKYTPPPAVGKDDIAVYEQKNKLNVANWVPAQGDKAGLELAIVIDDATLTDFGLQLKDLQNFITNQPKSTGIAIFYANNGTVEAASQFNTDHQAVAKALRIPLGRFGAYSSIYLSMLDLIKRWPVTGARREVLLFSDGVDRFRGDIPTSTDLESTIERAQTGGVIIHSIYATAAGRIGRSLFRVNLGQSNLSRMSDETGGESFFQGLQTPLSLAPFLEQLDLVLKNQYFVTFTVPASKKAKGELKPIRVRTELPKVEISHPSRVFVPGSGQAK